jgi:hypothetical protein
MRKIYWQIGSIVSLLVINIFWWIEPAKACSCDDPSSLQEAMKRSSRTFIGKVLDVEEPQGGFTLAVSRIWKGKKQSRIIVRTSDGMCRSTFIVGEEYLVFSYSSENTDYTSVCSKTSMIKHFSPAEIRTLGKGRIVR